MRIALLLCHSIALAGCASLSKQECLNGNWEEIGFRDGTDGRETSYLQRHTKACERAAVTPVQNLWEKGRQRGLPVYCVPAKAFSVGKKGQTLRPVCPAAQMPALQAANAKGLAYHEFTEEIGELTIKIDELESQVIAEQDAVKRALILQESRALRREISFLELQRADVSSL